MHDVTGVTAMALESTGRGDLVEQLNTASRRFPWWWPTAIVAGVLGLLTMPWGLVIWLIFIPLCAWLYLNDQARRSVVSFYDVHDSAEGWFSSLVTQWSWLTESEKLWRIIEAGDVTNIHQFKRNSGASTLTTSMPAVADLTGPTQLKTNIAVPSVTAGNVALYLLPDRLLVRDGKRFSDIDYRELRAFHKDQKFIEEGVVPADAVHVATTWKYVNLNGTRDRRFNNNRQLPVMLYGRLILTTATGLCWIIQVSRHESAERLTEVISLRPAIGA